MREQRKFKRYSCNTGCGIEVSVRIGDKPRQSCRVMDLSTGGFSFDFKLNDNEDFNTPVDKFMFVQLDAGGLTINAEVEIKWSLIKDENNKRIYTAGVSFNIISSEDRLRLNEIIENIRTGISYFPR